MPKTQWSRFSSASKPRSASGWLLNFLIWDSEESIRRERGTIRFDVFQDPQNQHSFYVSEAYEDAAAFEEHKAHASVDRAKPAICRHFKTGHSQ